MSKETKIRNTGQLRSYLAQAMMETKAGTITADQASRVCKLAAQINESFYSEVKIQKFQAEGDKEITELGLLPIEAKGQDSEW